MDQIDFSYQRISSRANRKAFTIVELLVVVAIIALLVDIMVPAVQHALDVAKNTVVKTQLHDISVGLEMFMHESEAGNGYYPESYSPDKSGAQLLSDAMMGRDLRGYDPEGMDDPFQARRRLGPYIKRETVEFREYGGPSTTDALDYVMECKWGSAILYYRADPGASTTDSVLEFYDPVDNAQFVIDYTGRGIDGTRPNSLVDPDYNYQSFWSYVLPGRYEDGMDNWNALPYNYDSFLLITAGKDRIYGNEDDVNNFEERD